MGYVNNDFGILAEVLISGSFLVIRNTDGKTRKMSRSKYKESADEVESKAKGLIGKAVGIRTSQNTGDWSESEWFSDIYGR